MKFIKRSGASQFCGFPPEVSLREGVHFVQADAAISKIASSQKAGLAKTLSDEKYPQNRDAPKRSPSHHAIVKYFSIDCLISVDVLTKTWILHPVKFSICSAA